MRLRRHSDSSELESTTGIDLAPMLDFVLNLLIFFIIIAVFVRESALMVSRPTNAPPPENAPESIVIQILENNEIWFEGRVVDPEAVRANIEREYAVDPKRGVLINSHKESETGVLVKVVDQIHLGGIYNITFTTPQ